MTGTFVSFSGSTIVLADGNGIDTPYGVMTGCKVTINGKKAEMADLKAGDYVELNHDPASELKATNDDAKPEEHGRGAHEAKAEGHTTHTHPHAHVKEEEHVKHPRVKEEEEKAKPKGR